MNTRLLYLLWSVTLLLAACAPRNVPAERSAARPVPQSAGVSRAADSKPTPDPGPQLVVGTRHPPQQPPDGHTPPSEAVAACNEKTEQAACEFSWQKGNEQGVCETVQDQLICSPQRQPGNGEQPDHSPQQSPGKPADSNPGYTIEQAISDRAQEMTIAYDALAFLTGNLGADSFFPPGKVADFWGFQYLRDNDPSQMGHAGDFLTRAAMNMLNTLTAVQRAELVELGKGQVDSINQYASLRFVLMDAFRRLLEGNLPAGTTGLNQAAVQAYSAKLYRLDGEISFARAQKMGGLLVSLDATQRASLDQLVGKGMLEWPEIQEPADLRGLDRDVKVAVMTYAADLFSWYAGSIEADVYFCPERHGTYFGSFYLKDRPAMENPGYSIPNDLTGNMGAAFLETLTAEQAQKITGLVETQRPFLQEIVTTRQQISTELRRFKTGGAADPTSVMNLMEKYGALDGELIYHYAARFVAVNKTLSPDQKTQLMTLRQKMLGNSMYPTGAYLYSQPIAMPAITNTDFLFK